MDRHTSLPTERPNKLSTFSRVISATPTSPARRLCRQTTIRASAAAHVQGRCNLHGTHRGAIGSPLVSARRGPPQISSRRILRGSRSERGQNPTDKTFKNKSTHQVNFDFATLRAGVELESSQIFKFLRHICWPVFASVLCHQS